MKICTSLLLLFYISIPLIQGQTTTTTQEFSYAYGLKTAILWKEADIPERERNIEHFILGIKEGLKGDKLWFRQAQEDCDKRWASNTVWVASFPRSHGIVSLTTLATEVDIPVRIFDFHALREGYAYGMKKKKIKQTKEALDAVITQQLQPYQDQYDRRLATIDGTIEKGAVFLAKNAKKKGVVTLASGLQYCQLEAGNGPKIQPKDKFKMFYKTTFMDGRELVYLHPSDKPILGQLDEKPIHKWVKEAYPMLSKGSKYRFFVPHQLGIGRRDTKRIPGGSVMIHEIEILEIFPEGESKEMAKDKATVSYVYGKRTAELMQALQIPPNHFNIEELIEGIQQNLLGVSRTDYQLAKEHYTNYLRYKRMNADRSLSFDLGMVLLPNNEESKKYPSDLFDFIQLRKGFLATVAGERNTLTTSEMNQMVTQYFQSYAEALQKKAQDQ